MFIVMGFFADQVHDYNKGWVVNIDDRIVAVDYYVRSEGLHIIVIAEEWIPYNYIGVVYQYRTWKTQIVRTPLCLFPLQTRICKGSILQLLQ